MSNATWPDRLAMAGFFFGAFGVYLIFGKGPAANPQQYWFRIGIAALGVILGIAALVMKFLASRNSD